jgi:hypothetical protein
MGALGRGSGPLSGRGWRLEEPALHSYQRG